MSYDPAMAVVSSAPEPPHAAAMPFRANPVEVNIVHVRYFLAVCDLCSFTLAARHCRVSQPTLSMGIRRLERQFGTELFRREKSPWVKVQPTRLALEVKPHLEAAVANLSAAMKVARQAHA
jgi:DNA-binding transcriptional LysR family regulator